MVQGAEHRWAGQRRLALLYTAVQPVLLDSFGFLENYISFDDNKKCLNFNVLKVKINGSDLKYKPSYKTNGKYRNNLNKQ